MGISVDFVSDLIEYGPEKTFIMYLSLGIIILFISLIALVAVKLEETKKISIKIFSIILFIILVLAGLFLIFFNV